MKKHVPFQFNHLVSISLIILISTILGCYTQEYSRKYSSKTEAKQYCDKWKKEGPIIKIDPQDSKESKSEFYTRLCKEDLYPKQNILGIDYSSEIYNGMSWSSFKETDYSSHIGMAEDGYEWMGDMVDYSIAIGMTKKKGPKVIRKFKW